MAVGTGFGVDAAVPGEAAVGLVIASGDVFEASRMTCCSNLSLKYVVYNAVGAVLNWGVF